MLDRKFRRSDVIARENREKRVTRISRQRLKGLIEEAVENIINEGYAVYERKNISYYTSGISKQLSELDNMTLQEMIENFCDDYAHLDETERNWHVTLTRDMFVSELKEYIKYNDEIFDKWHFTQYLGFVLVDEALQKLISKYQHLTDEDLSKLVKVCGSDGGIEPGDYWPEARIGIYSCNNYEKAEERLLNYLDDTHRRLKALRNLNKLH